MKSKIVIGLSFGDEGKGLATDYLCSQCEKPLVIRFNGGQQAGHTVATEDGKRHVFSNFGSGTLRGVPTYWSRFCTFSPTSMLRELAALEALNLPIAPRLLVDNLCPVTTHYDVLYNRILENGRGGARHGSCGMGFGATIERHDLSPIRLFAQDLLFPDITKIKLASIRQYYREKVKANTVFDFDSLEHDAEDARFLQAISQIPPLSKKGILDFVNEQNIFIKYKNTFSKNKIVFNKHDFNFETYIFEGAQGVLLDMDFGFFPHVTRSNTTSQNALFLFKKYDFDVSETEIFYITRAYQTRHGEGPMTNKNKAVALKNNTLETNQYNAHQGDFRTSLLDVDLLNYALRCDNNFSDGLKKNLLVTCVDQVEHQQITFSKNGVLETVDYADFPSVLDCAFEKCLFSFGDNAACIV